MPKKKSLSKSKVLQHLKKIFASYKPITKSDTKELAALKEGKLYELFCLARVVAELKSHYGYSISFHGNVLEFKQSPGKVDNSKSHFVVRNQHTGRALYLHTDIEFRTLGSLLTAAEDLSAHHEIDIVLLSSNASGYPTHDEIVLGVECKAHTSFGKATVKEVLGIRREMSWLSDPQPSTLAQESPAAVSEFVPAIPSSEYWLTFIDDAGLKYAESPAAFGIKFHYWRP